MARTEMPCQPYAQGVGTYWPEGGTASMPSSVGSLGVSADLVVLASKPMGLCSQWVSDLPSIIIQTSAGTWCVASVASETMPCCGSHCEDIFSLHLRVDLRTKSSMATGT